MSILHIFFLQTVDVYFEDGYHSTNVYLLEELLANQQIAGPAIIIDKNRSALKSMLKGTLMKI